MSSSGTRPIRAVSPTLLIVGILLIALNLRPAIAGVGPLVADIRGATGMSGTAFGLLTTLPLLAFGVISGFAPLVTRRIGVEGALVLGMALLAAGALMRSGPGVGLLFAGTAVLGTGIALGNVLLPAVVKRSFAGRSGPVTSLYSSAMGFGAAVAAGVSVPIAAALGWRASLAVWAVPAAVALIAWLPILRRSPEVEPPAAVGGAPPRRVVRSPLAWHVALFMGVQSVTFYAVLAWLPDLLQSRGMSAADAGWMLALSQVTGIAGTAIVPVWAGRLAEQRRIVWTLGTLEAMSLVGAMLPGLTGLAFIWVSLLGFILGGTFGLALLFLVLRAGDTRAATELSAMAQSVGYLVAAIGPVAFGLLYDLTGDWLAPLLLLVAALVGKTGVGLLAARPGQVG